MINYLFKKIYYKSLFFSIREIFLKFLIKEKIFVLKIKFGDYFILKIPGVSKCLRKAFNLRFIKIDYF